jgi:hypothetical protein
VNGATWRARADALRAIPLRDVLRSAGARPDPGDGSKWHFKDMILSVTEPKFMDWTRGVGGGGAIDLAIHLQKTDFMGALAWLAARFPEALTHTQRPPAPRTNRTSFPQFAQGRSRFTPSDQGPPPSTWPEPVARHLGRVRAYLHRQRALPLACVDPVIAQGRLYADQRANAVFLLRDRRNRTVGAELRGSGPVPWKGMARGSRKDAGYFDVSPRQGFQCIVLCESAIDALSCSVLHPQARCISMAGVRANASWLPLLLAMGLPLYCGFDTDPSGERAAKAMAAIHPSIQRLRPGAKDWNDLLQRQS